MKSPRNPVLGGETGVRLVRFTLFGKRAFETFAAAADGIAGQPGAPCFGRRQS